MRRRAAQLHGRPRTGGHMTECHMQMFRCGCVAIFAAWLSGCVGTTTVKDDHPLIASASALESTKVYFIRPDPGFRGVMDMPVTISLGGSEMLGLAKGQYALLSLKPGRAEMKVDSYTVVGTSNTMTPVSTTSQLNFSPGVTQYLVFELVPQGPLAGSVFVPRQVSRERALDVVRGLSPAGLAVREPLQ
jgi:hypothetical protein